MAERESHIPFFVVSLREFAVGIEKRSLRDLLRVAIHIEERLMGLHADVVAQVEELQWLNLFKGLSYADADHAEVFRQFERRRFPVWPASVSGVATSGASRLSS